MELETFPEDGIEISVDIIRDFRAFRRSRRSDRQHNPTRPWRENKRRGGRRQGPGPNSGSPRCNAKKHSKKAAWRAKVAREKNQARNQTIVIYPATGQAETNGAIVFVGVVLWSFGILAHHYFTTR